MAPKGGCRRWRSGGMVVWLSSCLPAVQSSLPPSSLCGVCHCVCSLVCFNPSLSANCPLSPSLSLHTVVSSLLCATLLSFHLVSLHLSFVLLNSHLFLILSFLNIVFLAAPPLPHPIHEIIKTGLSAKWGCEGGQNTKDSFVIENVKWRDQESQ